MSTPFISKSRRVRFDLTLQIHDLNNVPLVSGTSLVKWHLPSSTAAEHRGRTLKSPIKDHRVTYSYTKQTPVRLTVSKSGMLQECHIDFEILQEYSAGGRGERIVLGHVRLNLAEYAGDAAEGGQSPTSDGEGGEGGGITRRYLMQDSKINSTLKIGVAMRHIEGTRDYYAPPLRTAPVFGGIAGIISSSEPASTAHGIASHTNGDEPEGPPETPMPNFSSTSKENGEMQDMYRRTLAAFWASQPGELRADECIEDIFAGGDGWGSGGRPLSGGKDEPGSGSSTPNPDTDGNARDHPREGKSANGINRMVNRHNFARHSKSSRPRKGVGELEEMEVRDDLISWQIGERAHT